MKIFIGNAKHLSFRWLMIAANTDMKMRELQSITLPETNIDIARKKIMVSKSGISWLPAGAYFQGRTVSFREGNPSKIEYC